MRAAYLDDLRSKFLLENSVLKMEYADVRVLHLAHKVWTQRGLLPLAPSSLLSPHQDDATIFLLACSFIRPCFLSVSSSSCLFPCFKS